MSVDNVLPRLTEGCLVVIPGDRSEVLLAVLTANASETFPSIAGVVLNGGFELAAPVAELIEGLDDPARGGGIPIITTTLDTYPTAQRIAAVRGKLSARSQRKIDTALALFETHVDATVLTDAVSEGAATAVTPLMFEYTLLERAREDKQHIVLPEGGDDRILQAASTLLARGVVDAHDPGRRGRHPCAGVGARRGHRGSSHPVADRSRVRASSSPQEYAKVRAHKGMTVEEARGIVTDLSYFGTMMVHLGMADGMVSGAQHTTAHTIKPSFEIIKTVEGVSIVSSVFFMALEDRVLVYGDCAIVPDPTSDQLADIAISSAETSQKFGIEPRVAMLSYSTGESGSGADVDKVRAATELVKQRMPQLPVEGPIQYDAAADAAVAKTKMPESTVAGRATVFIFPDLNTGNNTYKAVQRSSGAVAIGPVLQGLRKPVNDLSRGALVRDIVNTVAITAIQAQGVAEPGPEAPVPEALEGTAHGDSSHREPQGTTS